MANILSKLFGRQEQQPQEPEVSEEDQEALYYLVKLEETVADAIDGAPQQTIVSTDNWRYQADGPQLLTLMFDEGYTATSITVDRWGCLIILFTKTEKIS